MVMVKAVRDVPKPVTLSEIKAVPRLKDMTLVRFSRLSVQPVKPEEWKIVCAMGGYQYRQIALLLAAGRRPAAAGHVLLLRSRWVCCFVPVAGCTSAVAVTAVFAARPSSLRPLDCCSVPWAASASSSGNLPHLVSRQVRPCAGRW